MTVAALIRVGVAVAYTVVVVFGVFARLERELPAVGRGIRHLRPRDREFES